MTVKFFQSDSIPISSLFHMLKTKTKNNQALKFKCMVSFFSNYHHWYLFDNNTPRVCENTLMLPPFYNISCFR